MMFILAITRINILPKYGVTLQNVEFRQCKIKYGYLWKGTRAFVKYEYFAAILYRHRIKTSVQKSVFIFWWKIALFTYFKTNILKADFFFSENGLLKDPFQETTNNFSIIFNGFVHKIDQKLHIQKFPLTGR